MKRLALILALAAPAAHPALRTVEPLNWSRPGADHYTGGARAALEAMGLPADVRARLLDRIERGDADGIAWFRRDGIVADDGTVFAPYFDMGTGRAWAPGSRVGFGPERTERAALYRDGPFAVAVPDACGNVSRLYPPGWPGIAPPVAPAAPALPPGGWWPSAPIPPVLHGEPGYPWAPGTPELGWPLLPPGVPPAGFFPDVPGGPSPGAAPGWPGAAGPLIPGIPVPVPATAVLVLVGAFLIARSSKT